MSRLIVVVAGDLLVIKSQSPQWFVEQHPVSGARITVDETDIQPDKIGPSLIPGGFPFAT